MNKKIILINTTMFLICFMTACSIFPDGTVNSAEETIAVTVDGSGQLKGNLNDAIEVDADNSKTVHTGDVYDVKIKPVKKNKEKSDINAEKFADYLNLSIKDFSYNGNGDNFIYTLSDGTKYSDGRNIQYYSQDDVIRNYRIYISDNVKNDFPLYELEDFSLEEAKSKAQEVFNLFPGISISSEPIHAYAIDAEHAQDYQKKHKYPNIRYYIENDKEMHPRTEEYYESNGQKILWNKSDEVYYMEYALMLKDMQITYKQVENSSYSSVEYIVRIVMGRDGLKKLEINGLYDIQSEDKISGEMCSIEEALQSFADSYQYTSQLNKKVITDVYLAYVPFAPVGEKDPIFAAHPYWVLQTETEVTSNKNGETVTSKREQIYLVDTINKSIFIGR